MTERDWPGGWYVDALPDGRYAALIQGDHLETDFGIVRLPAGGLDPRGQNPLYLVRGPGLRLAGAGNADDRAYEWDGAVYQDRGYAFGNYPVIYNLTGALVVKHEWTELAGYRYVRNEDGVIITCDETRADLTRHVYDYTTQGDLTVGQGGAGEHGEDPLIVLHGDLRYRLADGRCRMVRFHRDGDSLAIAWVQEDIGHARILWLTVAELAQFPIDELPPPPDPPSIDLVATPLAGIAPLTVHAAIEVERATTWRWLQDGAIVASDGLTHTYADLQQGSYDLSVRAAGPGGTTTSAPVRVMVQTGPPPPTFWPGVVCWGEQETADTYATLHAKGWRAIRLACAHVPTDRLAAAVAVPQAAGLRVVACIWPPSQIDGLPDGIDCEVGNEPDLGTPPMPRLTPGAYAAAVLSILEDARRKGITLWAGAVSNTDPVPLGWLKTALALLPQEINASLHRYRPEFDAPPSVPRKPYQTRAAEMAAVKAVVSGRRFAVTELGWENGAVHHGWWLFGHWHRCSLAQQAAWTHEELALWREAGATLATVYQINDGFHQVTGFGLRDGCGRWKPVSDAVPV